MKAFFKRLFQPKASQQFKLAQQLRRHCAHLMLERDEFVFFNPIEGMFGPIEMWGSINPSFQFQAFNYERKEYMTVRVEISSPDRFRFYSKTADEGYDAETDPDHERLAFKFFSLITAYFPLMGQHRFKRTANVEDKKDQGKDVQDDNREVKGPSGT